MRDRLILRWQVFALIAASCAFIRAGLAQDCSVNTVVRILDEHRQPLAKITSEDLRVDANSTLASVAGISPQKPRLILILDVSGTMRKVWNESIAAAREIAKKASAEVDVFAFRERIEKYSFGRSKSEELLDQLFKEGPPKGVAGTALYDTLVEVARHVKTRNATIVVISDGGDNSSRESSSSTTSLFVHSSWPPVFGLILDYEEEHTHRDYLRKISSATGGLVVYPSKSKVLSAADELAEVVLDSFNLTLRFPQTLTGMQKMNVQVIGPDAKPRKDVSVLHFAEIGCNGQSPLGQ